MKNNNINETKDRYSNNSNNNNDKNVIENKKENDINKYELNIKKKK